MEKTCTVKINIAKEGSYKMLKKASDFLGVSCRTFELTDRRDADISIS
jgi:hypothetical protein